MTTVAADFEFLKDLYNRFLSKLYIRKRLRFIDEYGFTDWEKWFQIEFAYFLADSADIEWYREVSVKGYSKKKKVKINSYVDFALRRKGYARRRFILLEMKQHNNYKYCIDNMFGDLYKIYHIDRYISKGKRVDVTQLNVKMEVRTYWGAGIHWIEDESIVRDHILTRSDEWEWDIHEDDIYIKPIKNTDWMLTIF